jgi:hypothetical protein
MGAQHVRHDGTVQKRGQDADQRADGAAESLEPVDQEKEQHAQRDGAEAGQHGVQVGLFVVPLHAVSFYCIGRPHGGRGMAAGRLSAGLLRRQMFILAAASIRESRKSGCATLMMSLGLFPGGQALEVDAAVFRAQIMDVGARVGHDAAVRQRGTRCGSRAGRSSC